MAARLIIEDGSGVENANSYITIDEAKAYAADRNVTLWADEVIASNLVLAADFMETTGPYLDVVFNPNQRLEFPRAKREGGESLGIPRKIKDAQAQLLLDIGETGVLLTTSRQFAVKRRKLEGLEMEYATGSYAVYAPKACHKMFDQLMARYKRNTSGQLIR